MKKLAIIGLIAAGTMSLMAADGAALYKKCAGCHGAHGEKHALGKSKPIKGWSKDKLVESLKGYKAGTRNVYGMGGLMKGQVASYSDADIEAVSEYISKF
ncbi:c-type cytochrome [Nitrosophilus labii]|uniref:c-type cytochrome n=1 Tax=Nitrosophilus labii TaxID=2706014 RepID=UPI001656A934|nr:c-type cytochrome [Nitrosophilus labii]